jgi:hypothetical protein
LEVAQLLLAYGAEVDRPSYFVSHVLVPATASYILTDVTAMHFFRAKPR